MVTLPSISGTGTNLYLEIRRIELRGNQNEIIYSLSGIVGDGCDEALVRVELNDTATVEIIPICNDDASGGTLDQRVEKSELVQLILDALSRLYFCIEAAPGRRFPGIVSGYADSGRLYRFHKTQPKPHSWQAIAEPGASWVAA